MTMDSLFVRLIEAHTVTIAFWRSVISAILLITFLILFDGRACFRVIMRMRKTDWLYCFLIGSTSAAFVLAVENTCAANIVFIFAAIPVLAALYSRLFLREQLSMRLALTMIAVTLALCVIAYGSAENDIAHWTGDLLTLYIALACAGALKILLALREISMAPAIPGDYLRSAFLLSMTVKPFSRFANNSLLYIVHGACIAAATACLTVGPRFLASPEVSLLI